MHLIKQLYYYGKDRYIFKENIVNMERKGKIVSFIKILSIMAVFSIIFIIVGGGRRCLTLYNSDLAFHLNRIIGTENVLTHPINYTVFHQLGLGVNYFYPWLTILPIIWLMKLTHSIAVGYMLFLILFNTITGVIAYYSMKPIYKNNLKSLTFSVLYLFLFYRGLDLYRRADIGEFIAMTFMVVVFSALYQLIMGKKKAWIPLSLGMALIIYSHLLSAIITVIMSGLMLILTWNYEKNWKLTIGGLIKSIGATCLLSLGFLFPYFQQMKLGINPPSSENLSKLALGVTNLFNNSLSNSWGDSLYTIPSLGIICLIFLMIGIVKTKNTKFEKTIYLLGIISVILSTKLFPWNLFQKHFALLQFPWRFLETASIFLLMYGVSATLSSKSFLKSIGLIICSIMFFYFSANSIENTVKASDQASSQNITSILSYNTADYVSRKAVKNNSVTEEQFFNGNNEKVKLSHTETSTKYLIDLHSYKGSVINTPVLYYKGEKAIIDGKELPIKESSRGTIEILNVPQNGKIEITSQYTKFARTGQIISVISLLGLMVLIIRNYFKTKSY
ncbi:6-pyruvoyl-tetrahydropterin synthase-related protein [Ligilactobacillus aviarius]|uniref:6-pyruvoyl-tetrahydropterin synthase-related protein n=1 Tax=Ligilactobacillus aviarius TaxID=1606 RepID=UPI00117A5649|nr:6-pyruvoyl-tetrahydropterin synthase-related protein [Ligilactobacillus aviarius]